jgi:transcriptional/translational regulatory protein YebC/TACO1
VITTPEAYAAVKEAMTQAGLIPENSEITMRASVEVELDVEGGEKVLRFLDALEDLDDTQDVFSNAEIPQESYS